MVSKRDKEQVVDELIFGILLFDAANSPKPGVYLKRFLANDHKRKIIQSLTADDFNHRVEWLKGSDQGRILRPRSRGELLIP